jgi:hypothetical protein
VEALGTPYFFERTPSVRERVGQRYPIPNTTGRQHIEADTGASTKTTTKMRKRKNKREKNKVQSRPTLGSESPEGGDTTPGEV